MRPQPFPAPPTDPFGRPNPLYKPPVPFDPNVGQQIPQPPPLTPPGIDLGADMPEMVRPSPMGRPMPQVPQGPMTIPNPQSGPVSTGPFGHPYDPQSPNTPTLPTNRPPRPPVRNPSDTDIDYKGPDSPTQIPRPGQRGPQGDPFNQDTRGLDGGFPLGINQQLDNSMEGMAAMGLGGQQPQASRMAQGPEPQAAMPRFGQQGYADMIRQRQQQQGSPNSLQGLRTQAQGQTQPQTSQFQRDQQGQTRDSYGTRMSRIPQQPTQPPAPKPTGPTTVNLRTPNQGMKQQFTAGQNRALGNTTQTSASRANAMRNSASRYQPRAGLRTTANRAKPRTSLPQLYGN